MSTLHSKYHIDGLVQERLNPFANAQELRISCTKLSISDNNMAAQGAIFPKQEGSPVN